jgi:hypothetical protein
VLVGGIFTDHLIRLNADGTRDLSFTSPSIAPFSNTPNAPPFVATLALQSDGKILMGGVFQGGLMRLLRNGQPDLSFPITGPGFAGAFDGKVSTLAIQPDGQVLAGGQFDSYGGVIRGGLARLNSSGILDTTDAPVPPGTATYAWSDGSTGNTLTVAASGTYAATATFLGQTGLSNKVVVKVNGLNPASFTVGVTPTGPLSLCPGGSQPLSAQVSASATGTSPSWQWYRVLPSGSLAVIPSATSSTYSVSASSPGNYVVTATLGSGLAVAASATVSVGQAPSPSLTATTPPATGPITGLPGDNLVLTGDNLERVTEVKINGRTAAFTVSVPASNPSAVLTVTVPGGATNGAISLFTACSSTSAAFTTASSGGFSFPRPVITAFPPVIMPNSTAVVAGTGFVMGAGATTATFTPTVSGRPLTATVLSSTQLVITVPPGTPLGLYTLIITTAGGSSAPVSFTVPVSTSPALTTQYISSPNTLLTPSSYPPNTNLIIQAPATVTISGSGAAGNIGLTVGRLEVQAGATLNITDNTVVTGPAGTSSFLLAAGATLNVGHLNGLGSGTAAPGAIRLTSLFFSPDASYGYSGSQPQTTGTNLPSQVRSLTSTNSSRLTLSQPVSITQVLTMAGKGHFYLDRKPLTLLSNATGTALVVNTGAGRVLGTATVQRYINPVANMGTGFRYYGSPVKGSPAAVLAAPAFDYDQSRYRLTAQKDTLPLISYGFTTSSLVPNAPLEVGHGYRAAVPAATTVQFTGTLTTGDTTLTLLRTGNAAYNGWNLVSNPYPAPLNWSSLVADTSAHKGLEAAIYVYESTGTGTGYYRSYVNGISNDKLTNQKANGDLLIAMGQAFFVRVSKGLTTGKLTFRNAHRETSYGGQASFNRVARAATFTIMAEVQAERNGSGGGGGSHCRICNQLSRVAVYLDPQGAPNATAPFNSALDADARNLFSFSQQTLSIRGGTGATDTTSAIRAIAQPTPNQVIPLVLSAVSPGDYTLQLDTENLAQLNGTVPYLQDSTASGVILINITNGGTSPSTFSYPFKLSVGEVLSTTINRFKIVFKPATPLATTPASAGLGSASVFPNPTRHQIHVWVPALAGATQVETTLFNGLGQVVHRQAAPLPATGTALDLNAAHLTGGIYILRIQAGSTTVTRRVVLQD